MKSEGKPHNRLIGPGSNNYGRGNSPDIEVPAKELADKIWKSIQKSNYDNKVSKEKVLHHLKQLKAQIGKAYKKQSYKVLDKYTIDSCMEMIDKKIRKVKEL